MTPLLEISVETLGSAIAAEHGGANRIELCEDLSVGGITPCAALTRKTRAAVKIPIFAMIRPRGGSFIYSDSELAQMGRDIEVAKSCKMDGVVFGVLKQDNTVDVQHTRELVKIANPLPVTFHRAFDETPNLRAALEVVDSTDHAISVSTTLPTTPEEIERFWDAAHQRRHLGLLADYAETIRTFEARHPDVFVDMDLFQPSAIQPTLQIVDFTNSRDSDISETRAWVGKGCRDLDLRCNLWLIPGK